VTTPADIENAETGHAEPGRRHPRVSTRLKAKLGEFSARERFRVPRPWSRALAPLPRPGKNVGDPVEKSSKGIVTGPAFIGVECRTFPVFPGAPISKKHRIFRPQGGNAEGPPHFRTPFAGLLQGGRFRDEVPPGAMFVPNTNTENSGGHVQTVPSASCSIFRSLQYIILAAPPA